MLSCRYLFLLLLLGACASPEAPAPEPEAPAMPTTVYLVRHAEKADDSQDPLLSDAGVQRAEALADSLDALDAIFVTPFQRTALTAAPAARRLGLTPTAIPLDGGPDSLTARTVRALRALPAGSRALVVGHSNTLGPLVAALGGPDFGTLRDCRYDALFVLDLYADGATSLAQRTYGADDACADEDAPQP